MLWLSTVGDTIGVLRLRDWASVNAPALCEEFTMRSFAVHAQIVGGSMSLPDTVELRLVNFSHRRQAHHARLLG